MIEPLGANTPWNFRGFRHLYIGGEAIAVGVMPPLQPITAFIAVGVMPPLQPITALAMATVVQYS
jgi:hypothetical protein